MPLAHEFNGNKQFLDAAIASGELKLKEGPDGVLRGFYGDHAQVNLSQTHTPPLPLHAVSLEPFESASSVTHVATV